MWTAYFLSERVPTRGSCCSSRTSAAVARAAATAASSTAGGRDVRYLASAIGRRGRLASRARPTRSSTASARGAHSTASTPGTRRPATCASTPSRPENATGTDGGADSMRSVPATSSPDGPRRGPADLRLARVSATASSCRAPRPSSPRCWRAGCAASSSSVACGSSRARASVRSARRRPAASAGADGGSSDADQAVLAINAWASGWPGLRSRVLAWGSYMVVTEPIPDRLAQLGLDRRRADQRLALHDQLLPHHARRSDRVRRRRRGGRASRPDRAARSPTTGTPSRAWSPTSGTCSRCSRDVRLRRRLGRTDRHHRPPLPGDRVEPRRPRPLRPRLRRQRRRAVAPRRADPRRARGRRRPTARPAANRRPPPAAAAAGADPVHRRAACREALIREDDALDAGRRPGVLSGLVAALPSLLGYRFGH